MIYIFDIDGTLADLSHRLHHIQKEPKDWDGFFSSCAGDSPIVPVIKVAQLLAKSSPIVLVSGRSDQVRRLTQEWLLNHGVPFDGLFMRKAGDHRSDEVVKPELVATVKSEWPNQSIGGIFEDRAGVVKTFRELGYTVFQVADGNF